MTLDFVPAPHVLSRRRFLRGAGVALAQCPGDQVLRLVASNLARVTGGGRAYRCGGEEFNILFPGKITSEVAGDLERLRQAVESSEFRMRGNARRQIDAT